jgi:hypothetical protein
MNCSPKKNGRNQQSTKRLPLPNKAATKCGKKNKDCKTFFRYFKDDRKEVEDDTDAR